MSQRHFHRREAMLQCWHDRAPLAERFAVRLRLVIVDRDGKNFWGSDQCRSSRFGYMKRVSFVKMIPHARMAVHMDYYRTEPVFTRTYKQICDNITIE